MDYEIKYAKRKTVTFRVREGRLYIIAPIGISERYINELVIKHKRWIERKIEAQNKMTDIEGKLTPSDISALKREARKYLTALTERYAELMGIEYGKIRITSARGRFGSCSPQKNISYSYRLMLYPEAAREYVVVHELAHIREMNHSGAFYAIIEAVLPDYKQRKLLLK